MKAHNLTKAALVLGLTLSTLSTAIAAKGGDSGGGGDALEGRVNEIRSDLLNWINNGGAKELTLPADISYGEYEDKMTEILENKKVALSFTYEAVKVKGVEKTCRGAFVVTKTLFSEKKTNPQILCNISRFKETPEPKQYSLIHHEYAGLVNVEKNDGSASDYEISNQLTDFLEDKIVKKLAVKKKPEPKVEIKRDPTLERLYVKDAKTFKREESLVECRPFYDQLIIEQQATVEKSVVTMIDLTIKEYYEKNGLNKVVDTKIASKTVKKDAPAKSTQIVYIIAVNGGDDSTQIKFEMNIKGEYKTQYRGDISNYVDKLGRIKARELNCGVDVDFEYKPSNDIFYSWNEYDYRAQRPVVSTSLTNIESGYALRQDRNMDSYYQMVYEGHASMKKEL